MATATLLYGNLGLLMDLFRENPEAAADFFDLSLIRENGAAEEPAPAPPAA